MWTAKFFSPRYWAARYWAEVGFGEALDWNPLTIATTALAPERTTEVIG